MKFFRCKDTFPFLSLCVMNRHTLPLNQTPSVSCLSLNRQTLAVPLDHLISISRALIPGDKWHGIMKSDPKETSGSSAVLGATSWKLSVRKRKKDGLTLLLTHSKYNVLWWNKNDSWTYCCSRLPPWNPNWDENKYSAEHLLFLSFMLNRFNIKSGELFNYICLI